MGALGSSLEVLKNVLSTHGSTWEFMKANELMRANESSFILWWFKDISPWERFKAFISWYKAKKYFEICVFNILHTVILERIGGASNRGHRNLEVACSFERPIKARFSQDGFRRKGGAFQLLSRSKRYVARANTAEQTSELATNFQDFLERLTGF